MMYFMLAVILVSLIGMLHLTDQYDSLLIFVLLVVHRNLGEKTYVILNLEIYTILFHIVGDDHKLNKFSIFNVIQYQGT